VRLSRAFKAGLVAAVVASSSISIVAPTTTVPTAPRYEPRVADVVGVGASGLVYNAEPDGQYGQLRGWWHPFAGGSDVSLGALNISAQVVGDRLVTINTGISPLVVTQRTLPSGTPTTVPIPDGYTYVGPTAAGVLLVNFPSNVATLSLLAWGQTTPTVIPGFPGDAFIQSPVTTTTDAHGALISASPQSGTPARWVYVDTDAMHVWTLPVADSGGFAYFLGGSTIAWWQGGGAKPVIDTIPRPVSGDVSIGATTTRAAPAAAALAPTQFTLVPFGTDVLAWQNFHNAGSYGREADAPVYAVNTSGVSRSFTDWAHGLELSPDGSSLYAVTGRTPSTSAISRWDVGVSAPTTVLTLTPVPAVTSGVAVDGSRIVVADNSDLNGAITERTATLSGTSLSLGASDEIASNVDLAGANGCVAGFYDTCSPVVAGNGMTAFLRTDYPRVDQLVTFQGLTQTSSSQVPQTHGGALGATDGTSVLYRLQTQDDQIYSPTTGLFTDAGWHNADLSGGNVFAPVSTIPQTGVRITSVSSGTSTILPEPAGCAEVRDAQAAGSWALVSCTSNLALGGADSWGVVDRTGVHSSWVDTPEGGLGKRWLGNGFVIRDTGDGTLQWTALEDGTHTWYPLGTWTQADGQLAVDASANARTVAWVGTDNVVYVASIPVVARSGVPSAPTAVAAVAGDGSAALSWSAPSSDGGSAITGYDVAVTPACAACTGLSTTGTSTTVSGLTDGTAYTFTVSARNVVGSSAASAPASVTPRSGGTVHLVAPVSVLSSRTLASHAIVTLTLPSSVPANVNGAELEVAVTGGSTAGSLTAYAAGTTRPATPNARFAAQATVSALVVTRVGASRQVSIYNGATTTVTLSAALKAYDTPDLTGGTVHAVAPLSALASRSIASHATVTFALPSSVPATVTGSALVLTASGATASGALTVFSTGSTRPSASDLVFAKGATASGLALTRVGAGRSVSIYNSSTAAVTVAGVLDAYVTPDLTGSTVHLATPNTVQSSVSLATHASVTLILPALVGSSVSAADLVVSATSGTAAGTLTVYAAGTPRPGYVNLRFGKGESVSGAVVSAVGAGRKVTIYNAGTGTVTVSATLARWGTTS
jgi:hypothetical protein